MTALVQMNTQLEVNDIADANGGVDGGASVGNPGIGDRGLIQADVIDDDQGRACCYGTIIVGQGDDRTPGTGALIGANTIQRGPVDPDCIIKCGGIADLHLCPIGQQQGIASRDIQAAIAVSLPPD